MIRTNFKKGDILYKLIDGRGYAKDIPDEYKIFMYDGNKYPDGYGILIGFDENGNPYKKTPFDKYVCGANVRKATEDEIDLFCEKIMFSNEIK